MKNEKLKGQHSLPNIQLAKAFNFNADDLSANRAGFMTPAQESDAPLWQRRIFGEISRFFRRRPKTPRPVSHICGKIKLHNEVKMSYPTQKLTVQNSYQLTIVEKGLVLAINQKQYQVLSDNVAYHIYYQAETGRILSLERAVNDCHETETPT